MDSKSLTLKKIDMTVTLVVQQWDSIKIASLSLNLEKKSYKVCSINKKLYIKFQKIDKPKKIHLKSKKNGFKFKISLKEMNLNYSEKIDIDFNIDFNLLDFYYFKFL